MKTFLSCILLIATLHAFAQNPVPYRRQNSWGYADKSGKIIIEPQYDMAWPFTNGLGKVKKNGLYYLVDTKGETKTTQGYTALFDFSEGMAAVCKGGEINYMQGEIVGGKWGYISEKDFSVVIPFEYDRATDFKGKYAIVQKGGNWGSWGLIDNTGKIMLDFKYPSYSFDMRPYPGLIWYKDGKLQADIGYKGQEWNVIDITGKKISGPHHVVHGLYDDPNAKEEAVHKNAEIAKEKKIAADQYMLKTNKGDFNTGGDLTCITKGLYIADAKIEGKTYFGLIDETNNVLVPFQYDYVSHEVNNGLVKVAKNDKYGFCDLKGNEVISCKYAYAEDFKNGLAVVYTARGYKDNSKGYINTSGFEFFKSEPVYDVVRIDGKLCVADQFGNPLRIEMNQYADANVFQNKYIVVRQDAAYTLYSTDAKVLAKGYKIEHLGGNCLLVSNIGLYSLFDMAQGKITIDSMDRVNSPRDAKAPGHDFGRSYITKKNEMGAFSYTGRLAIPPVYAEVLYNGKYFILRNSKNEMAICDTNHNFIRNFSKDMIGTLTLNMFSIQNKTLHEVFDVRTGKMSNYKIIPTKSGYILPGDFVTAKKLHGYINVITDEILEPVYVGYSTIKMFDNNYAPVDFMRYTQSNGKYSYYNTATGKIVISDADGNAQPQGKFLPVHFGNNYYFYDADGKKAFEDAYEGVASVREDGYTAVKKNGKWGIIDRENNAIIPFKYAGITDMVDGNVVFYENDFYGLVNENDSVLIAPQYDWLESVAIDQDTNGVEYLFLAEKNGKRGIINQKNKVISPFDYTGDPDYPFSTGEFILQRNGFDVLFNIKGKAVLEQGFSKLDVFDYPDINGKELILATRNKKYGLYTLEGKEILPCEYESVGGNEDYYDLDSRQYFEIKKGGKSGMLCSNGKITIPVTADKLSLNYGDDIGFIMTKVDGKYGLYYGFHEKICDPVYDAIDFTETTTYACAFTVKRDGKYGVIDTSGKLVIPVEYDKIKIHFTDYESLVCTVYKNGKMGIMTKKGETLVPALFDKIEFDEDLAETACWVYKGKMVGLYMNGKEIVPCEFTGKDYGDEDKYSFIFFAKNGEKWGLTPTFVFEKIGQ